MKKSKHLLKVMGAMLLIGVITINFTLGNSAKNIFRPKVARAALDITCRCPVLSGNQQCLANNWGSECAPAGTTDCQKYNSNCEG